MTTYRTITKPGGEMNITQMLNQLSEYQAQRDALTLEMKRLLDDAMPAEVKERMAEIEAEFGGAIGTAAEKIAAIEGEVKAAVTEAGETHKGDYLTAVYNKGRVSWDTKGLEGFMVAHPEITTFRKEGKPYVTIRNK